MKMEQVECSEMSAYKIPTPGNHPEENIQQLFTWLFYDQLLMCNRITKQTFATVILTLYIPCIMFVIICLHQTKI
jgi:hypothetical protein